MQETATDAVCTHLLECILVVCLSVLFIVCVLGEAVDMCEVFPQLALMTWHHFRRDKHYNSV